MTFGPGNRVPWHLIQGQSRRETCNHLRKDCRWPEAEEMSETVSRGFRGLRSAWYSGCRPVLPQEATIAVSMGTNYLRHPHLRQSRRVGVVLRRKEGGESTCAEIRSSPTPFFLLANYGYSKMERVKGCLWSSLHKSILTPSVNGTILGEK